MSFNPKTKTYWKLVNKFATDIRYDWKKQYTDIQAVKAALEKRHPNAPRYMLDDILSKAVRDNTRVIENDEVRLIEDRQSLTRLLDIQTQFNRPKLRLIKGAA